MGRFLSPDWSGRPSAVPYASFQNPQSLSLYSYMRNNPLSGADSDGHCCWDWFKQQVQAFGHWLNTSPGDSATVTTSQTISYTPAQLNMARQMQNNAPVFALAMTVDAFALFDGEGEGLADAASAATGGDAALEGANYAQLTFSQTFSSGGIFAGQTVEEVAAALKSGTLSPSDVPIQYIVQDGNTLILNTRSAQALEQAGIPRSQWNAVNVTGDPASQARLAG